jgi:Tat protein secretion system quality control protein TatD with DNase activity
MYTAAKVAEIKGVDLKELDDATTANAEAFFNWR